MTAPLSSPTENTEELERREKLAFAIYSSYFEVENSPGKTYQEFTDETMALVDAYKDQQLRKK